MTSLIISCLRSGSGLLPVLLLLSVSLQAQPGSDTLRTIEILQAGSMRQITVNDSTQLQTLAIRARVRQGNTLIEGDSIVLNKRSGIAEVFGHVHISDADTVHTYSSYLKYLGQERVAYLKRDVRLTDGKATLTTQDLEYQLNTGIAHYRNGGTVVNGSTILKSREATYFSDTKDVIFRQQVDLKDPQYDMTSDSLRYNTAFRTVYFIAPTRVRSDRNTIQTRSGTYNMQTGEAVFLDRTVLKDSTRTISGNNIALDETSGLVQIEGGGKVVDSAQQVIILGDQILIDRKKGNLLATRKPVMILYRDQDSTFITADTLYSGTLARDSASLSANTSADRDSLSAPTTTDSIRYFLGYHHVKIFHDSLQAVADSLHFSTLDSVFRLFGQPVCWSGQTQLSADTMHLYTRNQKPLLAHLFYHALAAERTREGFFHQLSGRTMKWYFIDGNIDLIRARGNPAESVYYLQDADSAYIGMNRSQGEEVEMYFKNRSMNRIRYISEVEGTLFPMKQIPSDRKYLPDFRWRGDERPMSRLSIFE